MPKAANAQLARQLTDIPNIGPSIASDLRLLGIRSPADVRAMDPLAAYDALRTPMGHRHDPCVLPRAVPIVEAMTHLVLADHILRQRALRE